MERDEVTIAVSEAPPPNGDGHVNGNGHGNGGIAAMAIPAPSASEVPVTQEAAEQVAESGLAVSETVGAPENESAMAEAVEDVEAPRSNDEQLPRELKEDDLVVFRPWRVGSVVSELLCANITMALKERPDRKWSERIRDSYGPAKQLLDSVGEEQLKERLRNIVRSGEDGHRFTFAQAKVVVYKFLFRIAYAILPGIEPGLREWIVRRVQTIDEERGWFCPAAQFDEELREYRRWAAEQERKRIEDRRARESAQGVDEMLGAMSLLGGEVAITVVTKSGAGSTTCKVGDRVRGTVQGIAVGIDQRRNKRYVSGIRLQLESGLEAFVPISTTGWSQVGNEGSGEFAERIRESFPSGRSCLLEVIELKLNPRGGSMSVVVRIIDDVEAGPSKLEPGESRPGIRLGEEVAGRIDRVAADGVLVRLFAPDIMLFAPAGELAPDTALGDYRRGDQVEGVVIQGTRKPFELRITAREESRGKGEQPPPEHIIHNELVEVVREFATAQGLGLGEEKWGELRKYAAKAKLPEVLTTEEVGLARAFFGSLLKDVTDVPAEIANAIVGVVTTRGAYREEERSRSDGESSSGEDSRPFCRNNAADNGQRCYRHVDKADGLCDRCVQRERRLSKVAPKPQKKEEKKGSGGKQCKQCRTGTCRKH